MTKSPGYSNIRRVDKFYYSSFLNSPYIYIQDLADRVKRDDFKLLNKLRVFFQQVVSISAG